MSHSTTSNQDFDANLTDLSQSSVLKKGQKTEHREQNKLMNKPILFFDGICGMCNRSVNFALSRDKNSLLYFSPLQGETAKQLLSEEDITRIDTVILRPADGKPLYRRSAAVIRLLWILAFPWNVIGWILWCIPLPIRDFGYRIIAGSRYRLFGKRETCRIPTAEERTHFLP